MANRRGRAIPPPTSQPTKKKGKGRKKGARWHFGFENASLGPLSVGNFSMGSADKPVRSARNEGPTSVIRRNAHPNHTVTSHIDTRREQIGVVNGATSFTVTSYAINPGSTTLFPWISQMAPLYEQYRFHGMKVIFVPIGSGFATANVSGRVVLGADYDVMSAAPASLAEAENKDPNVGFVPYESAELILDPKCMNPVPKFNRGANYPPGGDPKTYDAGQIFVAVTGTPNTSTIGYLYIEYQLELLVPQNPQITAFAPNFHVATYQVSATGIPNAVQTPLLLTRIGPAGGLGGSLAVPASNLATASFGPMPAGLWEFGYDITFSNNSATLRTVQLFYKVNGGIAQQFASLSFPTNVNTDLHLGGNRTINFSANDTVQFLATVYFTAGTTDTSGYSQFFWKF